jgi:hypothetical protein
MTVLGCSETDTPAASVGGSGGVAGSDGGTGTGAFSGMPPNAGSSGTNAGTSGGSAGGNASVGGSGGNATGSGGDAGGGGTLGGGGSGGSGIGGLAGVGGSGGNAGSGGAGGSAGKAGAAGNGGAAGMPACVVPPPVPPATTSDAVDGTLIQFNDNGAWCWFQDERAVVDAAAGKLIIGSVANASGAGGTARDGLVEAVIYDLQANTSQRSQLIKLRPDDHNTPAFLIRPDGKVLTMYTGHNETCLSYYRTYDGTQWGPQSSFDWGPHGCPTITTDTVRASYENLYSMSAEGKIYSFVRSVGASPNMLVSTDNGQTFTYGGRLTSTPITGYVAGYYKYWGNGVDRIDFVATENHPRDVNTSLFHGYIKAGKSFDTSGKTIDENIGDANAPVVTEFAKIFAADTMLKGIRMTRVWMADFQTYGDGSMVVLSKARANDSETDHRFVYTRFDGSSWKTTYLSKAGTKLFSSEQDYTGLGALHPNDPHTIYISTTFDPRDDTTQFPKHEIFRGTSCDNGETWTWTPVTQRSTRDNLRPIVPAWDNGHTALLWWRGTYTRAQDYNAAVVGIIKTEP